MKPKRRFEIKEIALNINNKEDQIAVNISSKGEIYTENKQTEKEKRFLLFWKEIKDKKKIKF